MRTQSRFGAIYAAGGGRAAARRGLITPIDFERSSGSLAINAVPSGEQIGDETIVSGANQRPGAKISDAVLFIGNLRHHAHGWLPITVAIRIEMAGVSRI